MFRTLRVALLFAPFVLLLALAGCLSPGKPAAPVAPAVSAPPAPSVATSAESVAVVAPANGPEYVGDHACVPCHADICRLHGESRHAKAVRALTLANDGPTFRAAQKVHDAASGITYTPAVRNGECIEVAQVPGAELVVKARYVLGAGRYGHTFLGQDANGLWSQMRLTYYTGLHRWDYTPFLQPGGDQAQDPRGMLLNATALAGCLACHVTTLTLGDNGPSPAGTHFGIGCERCHGAGRAHIEAVRAEIAGKRAASLQMEDLKTASRERILTACSGCHTGAGDMRKAQANPVVLARFAATALPQSACYLKSRTLTCLSCHDAHSLTDRPTLRYEAVCLSCHSSTTTHRSNASGVQTAGAPPENSSPVVCKISPRSGCIRCHMPLQTVRDFSRIGFHNHWIRIYTESANKPEGKPLQ